MKKAPKLASILLGISFLGTALPANTNSTITEKMSLEEKVLEYRTNKQPDIKKDYSYDEISQIIHDVYRKTRSKPDYLSERFVREIIAHESSNNPMAISKKGARGLMQIMPDTWAEFEAQRDYSEHAFDPRTNLEVGIKYLLWLDKRFRKDYAGWENLTAIEKKELVLSAYNAGLSRLQKEEHQLENMPNETKNYVEKIIGKVE